MIPVPFPAHVGDFFLIPEIKPKNVLLNPPSKNWFIFNGIRSISWNSNVTWKEMKPCTIRITLQFEE